MKELLNSLSEMLDKKEVKSIKIKYSKVGDVENVEATINKENCNDIVYNIDAVNTNGYSVEEICRELANKNKMVKY